MICAHCDEEITDDEFRLVKHMDKFGVVELPNHVNCITRSAIGGINHLKGICTCCGGSEPPDPPEMTKREAANAAVRYWAQEVDAGRQTGQVRH